MAPRKILSKPDKTAKDTIIDATLRVSEQIGWDLLTLADIAAQAGIPLSALHDEVFDKTDILVLYGRRIDRKILEHFEDSQNEASIKDRLFDILMDRFDLLQNDRVALTSILKSLKTDPKQAVISLPHLCRSMTWMLELARVDTSGWKGAARVTGLTGVYLAALWTWMDDDTVDLSKTMKALDLALSRAEQIGSMAGL